MGFREILQKIILKRQDEEQLDDDQTRDKYLRSLRRQRRVQNEELEKDRLIRQISDFEKNRTRKHLFGIKDDKVQDKKQRLTKAIKKKQINILKEKNVMFTSKLRKKRIQKNEEYGFLSRGNV